MRQGVVQRDRYSLIWLVLFVYFVPVVILSFLSAKFLPFSYGRNLFSAGILFAVAGSITLYYLLAKAAVQKIAVPVQEVAEEPVEEEPEVEDEGPALRQQLEEALDREAELLAEIEDLKHKWHQKKQEADGYLQRCSKLEEEVENGRQLAEEQGKKKELMLAQYAQTINDLRGAMEIKQQTIEKLESSISDLTYDLDTLLRLNQYGAPEESKTAPTPRSSPPQKVMIPQGKPSLEEEGLKLLDRCINIAQKMTTSAFESGNSRFRNVPIDQTALDARRLYDSISCESSSIVAVYSLKERRILFANEQVRHVTGWGSETFVRDFPTLVRQGLEEWRESLSLLPQKNKSRFHLIVRHKEGDDVMLQGFMGLIPTGVFKNYAVIILSQIT